MWRPQSSKCLLKTLTSSRTSCLKPDGLVVLDGTYHASLMASAVTPGDVVPPLSLPFAQGATHDGAYRDGNLMRPVWASQLGLASAAGVPMPGYAWAGAAPPTALAATVELVVPPTAPAVFVAVPV